MSPARLFAVLAAAASALALSACTYDYLQRTDRVGYSAGDAVRANLARETTNPDKASMYDTRGLGRNGVVVDRTTSGSLSQ